MKILYITLLISLNMYAAIISGNQDKISIIGGSATVSSQGSTKTINSGEIIFMDASGISDARRIARGDMDDVNSDLKAQNEDDVKNEFVNLKFPAIDYKKAKRIRVTLINNKVERSKIKLTKSGEKTVLIIKKISLTKLKTLYPSYHKAALKYFKRESNKGRVPTIKMKLTYIKKVHPKARI